MNALICILVAGASHSSLLVFPELLYQGPAATGVDAVLENPGGVWSEKTQVLAGTGFWFTDSRFHILAATRGSWGARLSFLDYGLLEYQDETPDDMGGPSFRPNTFEISAYKSFLPEKNTRIGLGFGYIHQKIYTNGYTDYHISVGISHTPDKLPGLVLSGGVRNLGLEKITDLARETLPTQFFAGAAYGSGPWAISLQWNRTTRYDSSGAYLSLSPTGTELRFLASYRINESLTPCLLYSYGREIDPLEMRIEARKAGLGFSYGFRPSFRGFDPVHLITLEYTP